jgi:hypothetical protein
MSVEAHAAGVRHHTLWRRLAFANEVSSTAPVVLAVTLPKEAVGEHGTLGRVATVHDGESPP